MPPGSYLMSPNGQMNRTIGIYAVAFNQMEVFLCLGRGVRNCSA